MTIPEGFEHLTNQRNWYKKCNLVPAINDNTARSLKRNFKLGKIRETKMIDLLESAGYRVQRAICFAPKKPKIEQKKKPTK